MYRIKSNYLRTRCTEKVFFFGLAGVTTLFGHFLWHMYVYIYIYIYCVVSYGTIIHGAGWAPRPVWTGAENLTPTEIRSGDRSARHQSLYRNSPFFELLPTFNGTPSVTSFQLQIISRDVLQIERKMNLPFLLQKEAGETIQISYRHPQDFELLIVQSHKHYQVYQFFPRTAWKEITTLLCFSVMQWKVRWGLSKLKGW